MKPHFVTYRQHDSSKSYSLQTLRDKCHITKEGVSMLGISDAAESIGFRTYKKLIVRLL